jgi:SAM-dependent methyltransferase
MTLNHNRQSWNALARKGHGFARPATDEQFREAVAAANGSGWYAGGLRGKRVLCLAAGGGRAGPVFAAAGAIVTVVDLSPEMLALDRHVATERGLQLRTVEASMDDLSALPESGFDIVDQPVSTCYVPDVRAVYRAVSRVLVPGGVYTSQHKQPASLQAGIEPSARGYEIAEPYERSGPLPPVAGSWIREEGTVEYLHGWEELLGGLCCAGFVIEDVVEPIRGDANAAAGTFQHRAAYVPPYVRIKARRLAGESSANERTVWSP